ncbi:hypothetical protein DL98DRAFT_237535 [Cadophora sp. DSE1049]|nr:hypothetical protein DL98DRAFT_237535 [Cadophora sp. DSE1049]
MRLICCLEELSPTTLQIVRNGSSRGLGSAAVVGVNNWGRIISLVLLIISICSTGACSLSSSNDTACSADLASFESLGVNLSDSSIEKALKALDLDFSRVVGHVSDVL